MRSLLILLWLVVCWVAPTGAQVSSSATAKADTTVTGSATLISAPAADRFAMSCTNTSATVHVRWGDSAVTTTTGQRIAAGASVEIRSRAAIYMISEGASVTMSCTEEKQ